MINTSLPIHSTMHSNLVVRPVSFWIFFNFIATCACAGKDDYHFGDLFIFMGISTFVIVSIAFIIVLGKKQLSIENEVLIYSTFFGKITQQYPLSDLVDFKWANLPYVARTRGGGSTALKQESIQLVFKSGREIKIAFDEYGNFDVIKKHLFNYSVKHHIITLEPLEKRKHR